MCLAQEMVMGHRVNVMLDDPVWKALQAIPAGERSRLVSEAIWQELSRRRRQGVIASMDKLRKTGKHCGIAAEDLVRAERERH
jgi:hypothetical protein